MLFVKLCVFAAWHERCFTAVSCVFFPVTEDRKMEMFLAVLLSVVASEAPVVANPGFEQVREPITLPQGWGVLPQGWHLTHLPNQAHLVHYETTTGEGQESRAMLITVTTDHPDKKIAYNVHQDLPGFKAGKSYRVSANVRTQGLRTAPFICVQCLDVSKAKFVGFAGTPDRELTSDIEQWERIETKITVPEGTATFRVRVGITDDNNQGGTVMIDDIEVVETE
jgi:hypothetical protein